MYYFCARKSLGRMVEWSITPVLKTGVLRGTGGSNPSPSAKRKIKSCAIAAQDLIFNSSYRRGE